MLGLLCASEHPALAGFPTEKHCDWQWIDIAGEAPAIRLRDISADIEPIVQPIDDWNRNWKLGLLFECAVGPGRIMVCSIDLDAIKPGTASLLHSLLVYMSGSDFKPVVAVETAKLRAAFHPNSPSNNGPVSTHEPSSPDLDDPGQVHGTSIPKNRGCTR
jgi:beta-galactosidase